VTSPVLAITNYYSGDPLLQLGNVYLRTRARISPDNAKLPANRIK